MFSILSADQMREWENSSWKQGIKEEVVIRQAGRCVGEALLRLFRPEKETLFLFAVGKGHNGDDARVAAEFVSQYCQVKICEIKSPLDDVDKLRELVESSENKPKILIDGLFGIGLNRPLNESWCRLIRLMNDCRIPIVSVDIPSGLSVDGIPYPEAIKAIYTLTLGAPKTALINPQAAKYAGQIELLSEIGLSKEIPPSSLHWLEGSDFESFYSKPLLDCNKGTFGHLLILAGSLGYHGAAVLAAKAAAASGVGLVTVCVQPDVYIPVASQLQVQMVHPWSPKWKIPLRTTAIMMGPGLADPSIPKEFWDWCVNLWRFSSLPILADASALAHLPLGECDSSRGNCGARRILTPHPGEAARLLKCSTEDVLTDREGALKRISTSYGNAIVALKGYQTLVGRADSDLYLTPIAAPGLAQGGTGDVLAGFAGGVLAQENEHSLLEKVCYAVYHHAEVGAALDKKFTKERAEFLVMKNNSYRGAWTANDLAERM